MININRLPKCVALAAVYLVVIVLSDLDRLLILIYEFLFAEESRQEEAVFSFRRLMLMNDFDSYYIIKYYEAVRRYEDYKIFERKIFLLISTFDKDLFNTP